MALPLLSVVVCTRDRPHLLARALEGLATQSIGRAAFEVVVVDDGTRGGIAEVLRPFEERLPLRGSRQRAAGAASARNHGLFLARGELVLFLSDDLVAEPDLVAAHVDAHRRRPEPRVAVVGTRRVAPALAADPLVRFLADEGELGPSGAHAPAGEPLRFFHLDVDLSSCKRSFLLDHGVFDPRFALGCEGVELAWRLARHGLEVVRDARASAAIVDPTGVDEVCASLVPRGAARLAVARRHPDPAVLAWAEVPQAEAAWPRVASAYEAIVRSARELDRLVRVREALGLGVDERIRALLHRAYRAAFRASRWKGIARAAGGGREASPGRDVPDGSRGAPTA